MTDSFFLNNVDNYLLNKLSEEDKLAFENNLKDNTSLEEELKIRQLELRTIQLLERRKLAGKFSTWKAEANASPIAEKKILAIRPFSILAIAASFLLCFVLGVIINSQFSNSAIAQQLFAYEDGATTRSDDGGETSFSEIQQRIAEGKYDEALTLYQELTIDNYLDRAVLLPGRIYFLKKDFQQAEITYQDIINNTEFTTSIHQEAQWNLLGVYIASKQKDKISNQLDYIINNSNSYKSKAEALKKKYNSFWRRLVW